MLVVGVEGPARRGQQRLGGHRGHPAHVRPGDGDRDPLVGAADPDQDGREHEREHGHRDQQLDHRVPVLPASPHARHHDPGRRGRVLLGPVEAQRSADLLHEHLQPLGDQVAGLPVDVVAGRGGQLGPLGGVAVELHHPRQGRGHVLAAHQQDAHEPQHPVVVGDHVGDARAHVDEGLGALLEPGHRAEGAQQRDRVEVDAGGPQPGRPHRLEMAGEHLLLASTSSTRSRRWPPRRSSAGC
jgi:hypothetical protein